MTLEGLSSVRTKLESDSSKTNEILNTNVLQNSHYMFFLMT